MNKLLFNSALDVKNTLDLNGNAQNVRVVLVKHLNAERCFADRTVGILDIVRDLVVQIEMNGGLHGVVKIYAADFVCFQLNVGHFEFSYN